MKNNHEKTMNLRYEILKAFAAYCRGNAIKYSFRAGRKGPASEDLAKAKWYLERA